MVLRNYDEGETHTASLYITGAVYHLFLDKIPKRNLSISTKNHYSREKFVQMKKLIKEYLRNGIRHTLSYK